MASFSRVCLLVALVLAGLFHSTSAIVYNYTNFYNPPAGCSVATDASGNIFIGLCSQTHTLRHASALLSPHVADVIHRCFALSVLLRFLPDLSCVLSC